MFDRFVQPASRAWPSRLELALSNTCNLQCTMCNGELSSAIRTQREGREPLPKVFDDDFFEQLEPFLTHAEEIELIGGEPFLAREVTRVCDALLRLGARPRIHVTTNGTVWNPRVESMIRELSMSVSVSIDAATPATLEAIRVGVTHAEVLANRDAIRAAVIESGGSFTQNCCLMVENWHELGDVLLDAEAIDVRVEVIPVMYPAESSLFCLPDDELADVSRQLRHQGATLRKRLDRNRLAWDQSLARIDAHLSQARTGAVPVALRRRQLS